MGFQNNQSIEIPNFDFFAFYKQQESSTEIGSVMDVMFTQRLKFSKAKLATC